MLFAKDFKTAVAAIIVVAGLLGSGTANAVVLLSEESAAGATGSRPVIFAAEVYPTILPEAPPSTEGGSPIATSVLANTLFVEHRDVDLALLDGERYFLRFDLTGGAKFGAGFGVDPSVYRATTPAEGTTSANANARNLATRVRGGRDDDTSGIWVISVDSSDGDADDGTENPINMTLAAKTWGIDFGNPTFRNAGGVVLPRNQSATENTCYGIQFRMYDQLAAARSGAEAIVDASGTLMCFVPTITASVRAAPQLTASVAESFRRFTGASPASGMLATATVTVATMLTRASAPPEVPAMSLPLPIQNPAGGMDNVMASDVLKHVTFSLTGSFTHSSPFGFGEFKLGSTTMSRIDAEGDPVTTAANRTAEGKASTAMVTGRMTAAGSAAISVDVSANNAASATNIYEAIGQGTYKATWAIDQVDPGTGRGAEQNPAGGEAPAGSIMRDGTTVRIGYLQTTTELERDGDTIGWNQRLIITNHGSIAADVTLGDYNAEDGVTVTCNMPPTMPVDMTGMWTCGDNEEVMTTIAANSQLVLRVGDVLSTTHPDRRAGRTSGMLTIAQDSSQISVSSSHVTLPGGQTDTVRYWPLQ